MNPNSQEYTEYCSELRNTHATIDVMVNTLLLEGVPKTTIVRAVVEQAFQLGLLAGRDCPHLAALVDTAEPDLVELQEGSNAEFLVTVN